MTEPRPAPAEKGWKHRLAGLRWLGFSVVLSALCAYTTCASAQDESRSEFLVKAAFLYHFAKFVEWPAGSLAADQNSITLCVLGTDPFKSALDTIEGKQVQGRTLAVETVSELTPDTRCHLVFVSTSESERLEEILFVLANHPALTVSDIDGFAQHGGVIGLVKAKDKISFEINLQAAKEAGLKLSSSLLRLAKIVEGDS